MRAIGSMITAVLVFALKAYKVALSPLLPPACRFTPTCSEYAVSALKKYGPLRGTWLALLRLLRCNPFFSGGYDPA